MRKLTSTILLAATLGLTSSPVHAQLVINELMQSNIDCIMDDINDFPDSWVELYNSGTAAVNLNAYKLGKTNSEASAWQLPSQMVGPKQFVIIYCDKVGDGLHTDFRLESGKGGEVYLFRGGAVADQVTGMKKQPAPNIAYGRQTDAADKWGYQSEPTPGKTNCGKLVKELLGEPVFSEQGHVITTSGTHTVTLSLPEGSPAGTEIRYTINGQEPTKTSQLYTSPISFSSTRVLRAKLFCDGYLSPRSTVQSYIYLTTRSQTLPIISIVTDSKYLNDNKIGILVDGTYQSDKKNYEFNWRRPINLEYFEASGEQSRLNQLCEARVMGGATRSNKLKSLAVYANKRFGTKRLEYEFFPDQRPGITDFKSIALRNAGNDFDYLYMRDAIIQCTMAQHTDLDWQSWRPAVVYINGTYKGMLNIRDRSNEDNIYTYYDGLEDIDMFENWWELKEGDWNNYNQFREFYAEHGHTMAEYEKWMDCVEFSNLMIMNLYYNNQDFPGNNIVMWRPKAEGGRWRWIAKDTDFGLGLYGSSASYNTLQWLHNPNYDNDRNWGANSYDATRLFRRLMEDQDFFNQFIDRTAVYMGDFLNERGTRAVWDPMYDLIKAEYPYHRKLINEWWPNYSDELSTARNWLAQRTDIFYQQVATFYKLGTPTPLTVNKGMTADELGTIPVTINGIPLSEGVFDGKMFAGRSVTLNATSSGGQQVTGWDITTTSTSGSTSTTHIDGVSHTFTMPTCKQMAIRAVIGEASGIQTLASDRDWTWSIVGTQVLVSGLTSGTVVTLYDLTGRQLCRATATDSQLLLPLGYRQGARLLKVGNQSVKLIIK